MYRSVILDESLRAALARAAEESKSEPAGKAWLPKQPILRPVPLMARRAPRLPVLNRRRPISTRATGAQLDLFDKN